MENIVQSIIDMPEKYGMIQASLYILLLCFLSVFIALLFNEKFRKLWSERLMRIGHKKREIVNANMNSLMHRLLQQVGACAIFVLEGQNGTENLAGLPFKRITCPYEYYQKGHLGNRFSDILEGKHVSNFSAFTDLMIETVMSLDIEKIKPIDIRIYNFMKGESFEHMFLYKLLDKKGEFIGVLGVVWNKKVGVDEELEILKQLYEKVRQINNFILP